MKTIIPGRESYRYTWLRERPALPYAARLLRFDIEPRAGYVYAALSGEFTLASAKDVYRGILQAAAREGQPRILMDCTRITGEMTISDRLEFGMHMAEQQSSVLSQLPGGPQVAILAAAPIMDPGRFTQTVANNRGVRMRASESLQELLSWLGV